MDSGLVHIVFFCNRDNNIINYIWPTRVFKRFLITWCNEYDTNVNFYHFCWPLNSRLVYLVGKTQFQINIKDPEKYAKHMRVPFSTRLIFGTM